MNQTDKDIIKTHLHKAVTLIQTDRPATALRSIAEALSVVAVALESQTSGAHPMTLTGELTASHTHAMSGDVPAARDYSRAFSYEQAREITERLAVDTVKPLCPSGLLATLQGITEDKNHPCPACGLFHERRVVAVPLSMLGYGFVEAEATLRIGYHIAGKFRENDRIVFGDRNGNIGRGYVGDVTEIKKASRDAGDGFEAITKVITL